jgi:EmrB/QacA subfamily drug resistance transporter
VPRVATATPAVGLTLAVVSIGIFMTVLDLFIVNVAFPEIQRDFSGTSLSGLSWILNGYAIVFAALLVPAGRIADRTGQKRGFLFGLILFTLASALCAAATGPVTLVAARVLQAAGAAALTPTSLALLLNAVPAERRPWAIGIWTAVGAMAAAAGPTIGGLLVSASWRWVFLVNVPIGIVSAVVAARVLREHRNDASDRRPDLIGALFLTAAIAALALGLVEGPDWGWGSVRVVGSFAAAVALTAGFAWRSARHPSPIVEPALLRVRSFAFATVAALLFNAAFAIMLLSLVQFMSGVWGYSALRTGLAISPGPLVVPLIATRGQVLARRWGSIPVAIFGTLLFGAGGVYWANRVGVDRNYVADLLPGLLVAGLGFALALPVLLTTATRSLPPQRFATGSAVVTMARQIGTVLGVSILVVFLDNAGSDIIGTFHQSWHVMATISAAAALACVALRVRPDVGRTGASR